MKQCVSSPTSTEVSITHVRYRITLWPRRRLASRLQTSVGGMVPSSADREKLLDLATALSSATDPLTVAIRFGNEILRTVRFSLFGSAEIECRAASHSVKPPELKNGATSLHQINISLLDDSSELIDTWRPRQWRPGSGAPGRTRTCATGSGGPPGLSGLSARPTACA